MKFQLILLILFSLFGCAPSDPYASPDSLSCKDLAKRFDTYLHDASSIKFPQGKPIYVGATFINKSSTRGLTWQGKNLVASFPASIFPLETGMSMPEIPLKPGQFYKFDINRFILSGKHSGDYYLDNKEPFNAFEPLDCS
jgi:hypothetical protein